MTCSIAQESLGSYFDGELDPNAALQIRLHLSDCEACTEMLDRLNMLRQLIKGGGLSYTAPAALEARIRKSLRSRRDAAAPAWRTWTAIAAAILVTSMLSVDLMRRSSRSTDLLEEQALASHVRALMTGHTMDVVSTDRHTVKPWFNGRIDFSPPVNDLAQQGFPLVGARVDYLDDHPVAALVYLRRKHVIDLYVWPSGSTDRDSSETSRGYNLIRWHQSNMSYLAVSDLNESDLDQFRKLLGGN